MSFLTRVSIDVAVSLSSLYADLVSLSLHPDDTFILPRYCICISITLSHLHIDQGFHTNSAAAACLIRAFLWEPSMAIDQYFEEPSNFDRDGAFSAEKRDSKSDSGAVLVSEDDANFDCNICLDNVREPVVTLCGHLFCWPCIHKWLHLHETQSHDQCPVCKSEVSHSTLVPLYGRGRPTTQDYKRKNFMPRRPAGPTYRIEMPNSPYADLQFSQQIRLDNPTGVETRMYYQPALSWSSLSYSAVLDPVIVMFGEMLSTGLFGTQEADTFTYPDSYNFIGTSGPRLRRQMMQTDKSLSRICFFLVCCMVLCLLLF